MPISFGVTAYGPKRSSIPGQEHLTGRTIVDVEPPDCDVIVCQRPLRLEFVEVMAVLKHRYGLRLVVDLDDDFHSLHASNSAFRDIHPKSSPMANWQHLRRGVALADVVTTSTPALAQRYGNGRAIVVPNCVPSAALAIPGVERDEPLVGWSGTIATHPGDLEVTRGAVAKTVPVERFRVLGNGAGVGRALGYPREVDASGWVPFVDYLPRLASTYDIGIVPLAHSRFNQAKSGVTALASAAVGIPVVMSSTPDNRRLHADGVGLLAETPRQWANQLRSLLDSPGRRAELAGIGREAARLHTIEANVDRWLTAWTS